MQQISEMKIFYVYTIYAKVMIQKGKTGESTDCIIGKVIQNKGVIAINIANLKENRLHKLTNNESTKMYHQ